jgi:hypothetical protein
MVGSVPCSDVRVLHSGHRLEHSSPLVAMNGLKWLMHLNGTGGFAISDRAV